MPKSRGKTVENAKVKKKFDKIYAQKEKDKKPKKDTKPNIDYLVKKVDKSQKDKSKDRPKEKKAKKEKIAYYGMDGVKDKKQKHAVDLLLYELHRLSKLPAECTIKVFGEYDRVTQSNDKKFHYWRVDEIDVQYPNGVHASFQNGTPEALGLLYACQRLLEVAHVEPRRPRGWSSDLDERQDAIDALEVVWKMGEKPAKSDPYVGQVSPAQPQPATEPSAAENLHDQLMAESNEASGRMPDEGDDDEPQAPARDNEEDE